MKRWQDSNDAFCRVEVWGWGGGVSWKIIRVRCELIVFIDYIEPVQPSSCPISHFLRPSILFYFPPSPCVVRRASRASGRV